MERVIEVDIEFAFPEVPKEVGETMASSYAFGNGLAPSDSTEPELHFSSGKRLDCVLFTYTEMKQFDRSMSGDVFSEV
jgi:hypothetical protein